MMWELVTLQLVVLLLRQLARLLQRQVMLLL
jgi:hypothetical protein